MRAQILIRKVSPRAFVPRPDKKGQNTGEVGIEGTTIEAPAEVRYQHSFEIDRGIAPSRFIATLDRPWIFLGRMIHLVDNHRNPGGLEAGVGYRSQAAKNMHSCMAVRGSRESCPPWSVITVFFLNNEMK